MHDTDPTFFIKLPVLCNDHRHNSFAEEEVLLLTLSAVEVAACLGRAEILNCFFHRLMMTCDPHTTCTMRAEWRKACPQVIICDHRDALRVLRKFYPPSKDAVTTIEGLLIKSRIPRRKGSGSECENGLFHYEDFIFGELDFAFRFCNWQWWNGYWVESIRQPGTNRSSCTPC